MKINLLLAISMALLATAAHAIPPKPERCPGADSIASVGITHEIITRDMNGEWVVLKPSSEYDTTGTRWSFIIGKIKAADEKEALEKAKSSLASLAFKQGPYPLQSISRWGCMYHNRQNYLATAVTPDLSGGM